MYSEWQESVTFAISAENPTGEKGGGSRGGDCTKLAPAIVIEPGETRTIAEVRGPGIINHMWFTGYFGHHFIIRIYWDENEYPSVEAPLAAFFGCAYDENILDINGKFMTLNSALLTVFPGRAYNSYFEMPFHKSCRITMENTSDEGKILYYMITGEFKKISADAMYFHAEYRQEKPVQKGRSYTVIDGVEGQGRFLGLTLAAGMNGNSTCWVEGEAKMYIDDDSYPSVNYTGTEDYFCGSYAFGNDYPPSKRYQPYNGLYAGLCTIYGNQQENYNQQQRFLLYRFHVPDAVFFRKNFRMTLDNLGWTGPRYDDYVSVAYWYQTEPKKNSKILPSPNELCMK